MWTNRPGGWAALAAAVLALGVLLTGCSRPGADPASEPSGTTTATGSPQPPTATGSPQPTTATGSSGPGGVKVSGNRLVDESGETVVLRGVNRSGSEYACIDGWGFFDGPSDAASIEAMRTWGVNAVRVPLNSACWLDLREQFASYNPDFAGAAYQDAIAEFVDRLTAAGMYVVLDLHWTGCGEGECLANWIKPMPDRPYATQVWTQVANRFKEHGNVLFDLYNEPQNVDWDCWAKGGCGTGSGEQAFTLEGMAPMIDAVRSAGARTQPILVGGLQYANDMTGWLEHLPADPANSLVASVHLYNFNWPCPGQAGTADAAIECFSAGGANSLEAIAAAHPVVFGELGQDGCATDFVDPMLDWIDQRGYSVLGWAWNVSDCAKFPALISDYDGTPTAFGAAFRQHFSGS